MTLTMKRRLPVLLSMFFAGSIIGWAQSTSAIQGAVTDASGSAVAGAKVTVTETATALIREVNTGPDGLYSVQSLRPTTYKVSVTATGFRTFTQDNVTLQSDQQAIVNFRLEVGAVSESVEINATAARVDTSTGTISQVIDTARILELPLNGRNTATLAYTVAGTVAAPTTGADQGAGKTFPEAVTISANGSRQNETSFLFDGGNNMDSFSYVNAPFPFPDAVQEFSVQTSNYSAEYGMSAGGVVNITTKSGTNVLHGDAFEFVRNRIINARNYFAASVDPLKRNQYGFTIGGPVILPRYKGRDKTFFFFGYQGTQTRAVTGGLSSFVPTTANLQGDFSNVLTVNPNNPLGKAITIKDAVTGQPFPGNMIPASRLDPASLGLAKFLPSVGGSGHILYAKPVHQSLNEEIVRLDHSFSENDRLMGHYYSNKYYQASTLTPGLTIDYGDGVNFLVQNALIGETHIFRPSLVNDFRIGYHRETNERFVPPGAPNVNDFGVKIAEPTAYKAIESVSVSGFFSIGDGTDARYPRATWTLSDTLRWIRGRNSVAVGFRGDLLRLDELNLFNEFGAYTFNSNITGYALSDFLLGRLNTLVQGSGENRNLRNQWIGVFVQDDFRANRRLSFNFGLRWDPYFPWHDLYGRIEQFNPAGYAAGIVSKAFPNAPPGLYFPGDPGVPANAVNPVYKNFAPRFGFAYDLFGDSKTVLRGGGGIFYDSSQSAFFNSRMVDATPWSPTISLTNPVGPFSNPLQGITPLQVPPPFPPPANTVFTRPVLAITEDPSGNFRTPTVYNWNLTVERQLGADWLARVAYVGSRANHIYVAEELNPAVYTPGSTLGTDARRLFQGFTNISLANQSGNSRFNALELTLDKAFAHGLTLRANYTWSKSLDDLPVNWGAQGPMAAQSWVYPWYSSNADRLDRGPSQFDHRQRFVTTFVWQLPSLAHANTLLRYALGGWQASGLFQYQTGPPLTIVAGKDQSNTGINQDRAVLVGSPYGSNACTTAVTCVSYLNPSSFVLPAVGSFGNVGKGLLVGPGLVNLDAGVVKIVPVRERVQVQFRIEFFNIFNHANFNNPNSSVSGAGLGQVLSAADPRIGQIAIKAIF
ncbi:MAG: TonB-dependent receptor plug [Bryobacterales bacterium]|nr:TonB-dependent receptor plug [Bryobacterales bacterium]